MVGVWMRRVVGAWIVFVVIAGPRMVPLLRHDATILAPGTFAPHRKHPLVTSPDSGHREPHARRIAAERSAGSEITVRYREPSPTRVPPAFMIDPLGFLSTASPDSLRLLPGIGPVLADRIAGARRRDQGFANWTDVRRVHGIGPKTIARLQDLSRARQ